MLVTHTHQVLPVKVLLLAAATTDHGPGLYVVLCLSVSTLLTKVFLDSVNYKTDIIDVQCVSTN